jgi:hypothetical protein
MLFVGSAGTALAQGTGGARAPSPGIGGGGAGMTPTPGIGTGAAPGYRPGQCPGGHLKWVPGRCRRKFEIADVVSKS